jgi:hypothetical protein
LTPRGIFRAGNQGISISINLRTGIPVVAAKSGILN